MQLVDYLKDLYTGESLTITGSLGYVIAPNCIRRCLRLSQEEKMLLLEIYSLYNEEKGYAFPTQQTLAMFLGVTSSTVSKLLKSLEEKKFLISRGKKGRKKKYYPYFNLNENPYLVLSEVTHFATKVINERVSEDVKGDWGNKLLQFINVAKKDAFSESDSYGMLIKKFYEGAYVVDELIFLITQYVSTINGIDIVVDWEEEKKKYSEKITKSMKKKETFRKENANNKRRKNDLDVDPEWLAQYIDDDDH